MTKPSFWELILRLFRRQPPAEPPVFVNPLNEPAPVARVEPPVAPLTASQRVAAACLAACVVALPVTAVFEGLALKPYKDPAAITTWCYGETQGKPDLVYTKSKCGEMLRVRMSRDYAPKIAACVPQATRPERLHEFAALIDASYNAGPAAVCKSRMVASMKLGRWAEGCAGFEGWYVTARNRATGQRIALRGLVRRRVAEKALCLRPEA